MTYALQPGAKIGSRISGMRVEDKPLEPTKRYKVAGWAPVAEGIKGEPVWDVVERYLRAAKTIPPLEVHRPRLSGVEDNPGLS